MNASKVTTKGQVTIPKAVRERLRIGAGDVIAYEFQENGLVVVRKMEPPQAIACDRLEFRRDAALLHRPNGHGPKRGRAERPVRWPQKFVAPALCVELTVGAGAACSLDCLQDIWVVGTGEALDQRVGRVDRRIHRPGRGR